MKLRKLRSGLALFGVTWGTLTVIILLAIGNGFHAASQQHIAQIADGVFFLVPTRSSKPYQGFPKGQPLLIRSKNIIDLPQRVPNISLVSPMLVSEDSSIRFQSQLLSTKIYGVSPDYNQIRKISLIPRSRFLQPIDSKQQARVVVLGNKLSSRLLNHTPPLGKTVFINQTPFVVVGVIQPSSHTVYSFHDNDALIPYSTYINLLGDQVVHYFIVKPDETANPQIVKQNLRYYFSQRFHFAPSDKTAIRFFDTSKFYQFFKWFFISIQLFLGLCGILTLGVGSLGVANIMFLIVVERTREIGIRMAIGAKDSSILFQFIFEALFITMLGGLLGIIISYVAIYFLQYVTLPEWLGKPYLSPFIFWITAAVLVIFGLAAGYFPAQKAIKMDPVSALGY